MAFTEILTAHSLTNEEWDDSIFVEYITQMWWSRLMGESPDAIIQMIEDLTKKDGDAITVQLRGQLVGGHVTGNNKGIGNEGRVDFFGQRIVIDNIRDLVKFEDVPMSQKRVNFNLLMQGKAALVDKAKERMEDDITSALTTVGSERVRGRYLYGAADSNWDATHATALTNIDNTADQLTTSMISVAKRKANIPINATARIRPMKIVNGKNAEEWYVFVGHTYCLRDLVDNDAKWQNAQLNLTPRDGTNPLFTGSWFKGSYNGVLIYEYERLPLISSTIQTAHNLLLGAQAGAVVWGQRSKFGEEESDLGHDVSYEVHEIREESKLIFDRATTEDHGLINVFAAAVAD